MLDLLALLLPKYSDGQPSKRGAKVEKTSSPFRVNIKQKQLCFHQEENRDKCGLERPDLAENNEYLSIMVCVLV